MTNGIPLEEQPHRREGAGLIGWVALAALVLMLLAAGGWGWSAHRRAGNAEQALAVAVAERDEAAADALQRQALVSQVETAAKAGDARVAELEQQLQALDQLLQGANADVTRLRSELAAAMAAGEPPAAPATVAGDGQPTLAGSLGITEPPAVAAVEPAAAPAEPEPVAAPEALTVTFDVNSSYLPASLGGRLRELAAQLEPGRSYAVELVGSVGPGDVEGRSAEEAQRYNRWMAERRVSRVAEFLERNAKAGELTIRRDFALNNPGRQVVVEVRPAPN